jgi:hypothetical protein
MKNATEHFRRNVEPIRPDLDMEKVHSRDLQNQLTVAVGHYRSFSNREGYRPITSAWVEGMEKILAKLDVEQELSQETYNATKEWIEALERDKASSLDPKAVEFLGGMIMMLRNALNLRNDAKTDWWTEDKEVMKILAHRLRVDSQPSDQLVEKVRGVITEFRSVEGDSKEKGWGEAATGYGKMAGILERTLEEYERRFKGQNRH